MTPEAATLDILFSAPTLAFLAGTVAGAVGGIFWFARRLRRAALEAEFGKAGASLLR